MKKLLLVAALVIIASTPFISVQQSGNRIMPGEEGYNVIDENIRLLGILLPSSVITVGGGYLLVRREQKAVARKNKR